MSIVKPIKEKVVEIKDVKSIPRAEVANIVIELEADSDERLRRGWILATYGMTLVGLGGDLFAGEGWGVGEEVGEIVTGFKD